jgi:hypothetical protein
MMLLFVTAALTFQGLPTTADASFCDTVADHHGCCPACGYQWDGAKCVSKEPATSEYCKSLLQPEHKGCCRYCKYHWTGSECAHAPTANATADASLAVIDGLKPPPAIKHVATARYMTTTLDWGVLSTTSVHLGGVAFGNPNSFVALSNGSLFFYVAGQDASMIDVAKNNSVSFTLSEAQIPGKCNSTSTLDPEDPRCARLVFSGTFVKATATDELKTAMFGRHPAMKSWPAGHAFYFGTLNIADIWLIDFFGGASNIKPADYFSYKPSPSEVEATMGPPHGPKNSAFCPVTGKNITIDASTPSVAFKNGQKLYVATAAAAAAYAASPQDYWLAPTDKPLPGMDGMRGLPDLRGEVRHCPRSNESITIDMKTPRVLHKHGQAVYFCCFGCVTAFWSEPKQYLA